MMIGVFLPVGRGVSIYWWGCLYMLVGVSLYVSGGVSAYW